MSVKYVIEDGKEYNITIFGRNILYWFLNDKKHREKGPAAFDNTFKTWYQNDKKHRLDGPARIRRNGIKYWFINGKEFTEEQYNKTRIMLSLRLDKV